MNPLPWKASTREARAGFVLGLGITLTSSPCLYGADPAWWSAGSPAPVSGTAAPLALANVGQAKYMAKRALDALRVYDPATAAAIEADLVGAGKPIPTWAIPTPGSAAQKAHMGVLNVGQLKALADPFYTRLHAVAPAWLAAQRSTNGTQDTAVPSYIFPWTSGGTDDSNKAFASVGQLKAVFALRFEADAGSNGMPDLWEIAVFGSSGIDQNADYDGDGATNLQEYLAGTDPKDRSDLPVVVQIAAGDEHTLALASDGNLWTWGYNFYGELGAGTSATNFFSPTLVKRVSGMGKIVRIAAGYRHSAAIDSSGQLWTWGDNEYGKLGIGSTADKITAQRVALPPIKLVACGFTHTLAVDIAGGLWAWGDNGSGSLGASDPSLAGSRIPIPIVVPAGMGQIVKIAASDRSSYLIDSNGKIWAWGRNPYGQLGVGDMGGTLQDLFVPTPVDKDVSLVALPAMADISTHAEHVVARAVDGSLWAWGVNSNSSVGDGTTTTRTRPKGITAGAALTGPIAAGARFSMSAGSGGSYWSWGTNTFGETGTGSYALQPTPFQTTPSPALANLSVLAAGAFHTIMVRPSGEVWTMGNPAHGRLGLGTGVIANQLSPVKLSNFKLSGDDSDADGLPDTWERFYLSGLSQGPADHYVTLGVPDGATHLQKYRWGLVPAITDNDSDGMPDAWEIANRLDPLDPKDADQDADSDGLTNLQEFTKGSDPGDPCSLYPGILDSDATGTSFNYLTFDPDHDTLGAAAEAALGTNPYLADTDGDCPSTDDHTPSLPCKDDSLDAFPLDPSLHEAPAATPGDITAPGITLTAPGGATPIP